MPRNRRLDQATLVETLTPPAILEPAQTVAHFQSAAGKNLYNVIVPSTLLIPGPLLSHDNPKTILVEMPSKFRSTVWLRRGGYVVVELKHLKDCEDERDNKIAGEIVNIVGDERVWRKATWWPKEFARSKPFTNNDEEDNGQGRVGELPPSDDDEEEEEEEDTT